jgi:hypothetical protein
LSWDSHGPERSSDELLALVRAKADRIRWHRRLAVMSSAVVLVAVVLTAVALGGPGSAGQTRVQTLDHGTTSTSETTIGPPVTEAPLTVPSTTTPAAAPIPSTTRPSVATTPPRAATTVPPSSVAPTTTTAVPWPPTCAPPDLVLTAIADQKTSYAPGQIVKIVESIRNHGPVTCALGRNPNITIRDATGKAVAGAATADLCTVSVINQQPLCMLPPGQIQNFGMDWSHTGCTPAGGPCPAGTYTAEGSWSELKAPPVVMILG